MRSKKSLKNICFGVASQIIVLAFSLCNRALIAHLMSTEYLGLTGLFVNIFSILSLAEMGIGSAMIYALYKPVADGDQTRQQQLMNYYRKMYRLVAIVIAAVGVMLIPFLDNLVNTEADIEHLLFIYLMYLAQTAGSYLYVYKTSILIAHQKQYVCTIYSTVGTLLRHLMQFLVLYITHNYLLYMIAYVLFSLLPNFFVSWKAQKMYPYINENRHLYPDVEDRRSILKNVKALFVHNFAYKMIYCTDNILISSLVGLASVGLYSNYSLITNCLSGLAGQIFESLSASIGNLVAEEANSERTWQVYQALYYMDFLVYSYCTVALAILLMPFIRWMFGERYLLSDSTVLLLLTQFYMSGMRKIVEKFKDAMGLFRYGQRAAIAETVINLIFSVILALHTGMDGILAGTVISLLFVPFWMEPYILFRYGFRTEFRKRLLWHFSTYLIQTLAMLLCGYITWIICNAIPVEGIFGILLKGFACTGIYGIMMLICFGWTSPVRKLFSYLCILVTDSKNR